MTPTRARAAALLTALGLACLTGLSSGASAGAADPAAPGFGRVDPSTAPTAVTSLKQAPATPDRKAAVDALAAVRAIFAPKSPSQARASLEAGGVEATMALRDLAVRAGSLAQGAGSPSGSLYGALGRRPAPPGWAGALLLRHISEIWYAVHESSEIVKISDNFELLWTYFRILPEKN